MTDDTPAPARTTLKRGTIILAFPDDDDGLAEARAWLHSQGYTQEDVRLYRRCGQILGQLLRDV